MVPIDHTALNKQQEIPRIIMQTYYTVNATNIYHWNAFQTFVDLNPEYEVRLFIYNTVVNIFLICNGFLFLPTIFKSSMI